MPSPPTRRREAGASPPALAELASHAVVFDSVYASVPHTSKALIGILCGMFPHLEMPIVESLEGNVPLACLPGLLAKVGYRSAFLQSALGSFENRPGLVRNLGFGEAAFQETLRKGQLFAREGYLGMDEFAMLKPAVEWAARGGPEPFFLTLLTVTTHHPYEVAGEPGVGRLTLSIVARHGIRTVSSALSTTVSPRPAPSTTPWLSWSAITVRRSASTSPSSTTRCPTRR